MSVEPGTVTPLAFAALDPPGDPQLLFRRDPPVPDFQLRRGDVDGATVSEVPILWISGGALSQEPSATTAEGMLQKRARRATPSLTSITARASGARVRTPRAGLGGLTQATIAVGNREECAVAVGSDHPHESARRLRAEGVELAIVKLGGDGVLVSSEEGDRLIAPPPIQVLCGLGAGDAFGGALCHGLLERLAARAHGRVRQCGRRDRRVAAVVLAGDAL